MQTLIRLCHHIWHNYRNVRVPRSFRKHRLPLSKFIVNSDRNDIFNLWFPAAYTFWYKYCSFEVIEDILFSRDFISSLTASHKTLYIINRNYFKIGGNELFLDQAPFVITRTLVIVSDAAYKIISDPVNCMFIRSIIIESSH